MVRLVELLLIWNRLRVLVLKLTYSIISFARGEIIKRNKRAKKRTEPASLPASFFESAAFFSIEMLAQEWKRIIGKWERRNKIF